MIGLILGLNLIRFISTDTAPPGFFVDEAVGAAHVICLKDKGEDLFANGFPLFSAGLGAGYYTAPFLYGEALWTGVFGNSTAAFRTFAAFVTCLTLLFLFLWVRNREDEETGLTVVLLASVSPWVFQFSRIAWDPPLSAFFLVLGLYCFQSLKSRFHWVFGAIAFGFASLAYPGSRIVTFPLLLLIPGLNARKKSYSLAILFLILAPVFWRSFHDPYFTARARMLILWSDHPMNPFQGSDLFGVVLALIKNLGLHLSPSFLLLSGDQNLRHSTGASGMMSPIEWFLLMIGASLVLGRVRSLGKSWNDTGFLTLGALLGILPAALTWESVPHALRAIVAWPFLIVLAGKSYRALRSRWALMQGLVPILSVAFSVYFLQSYFGPWKDRVAPWFQTENNSLGTAYERLTSGEFCGDLQREILNGPFRNLK
jgi:hypothetical protein